jgi:hypothetical protein
LIRELFSEAKNVEELFLFKSKDDVRKLHAGGLGIDFVMFILSLILFAGYDYENNSAFVLFLANIFASFLLTLHWLQETWILADQSINERIIQCKETIGEKISDWAASPKDKPE